MSADITNKIAKAVEQAASSVLNKITSIPDTASEPIVIEDDVLDEINNDSFVSKKFVSQANKKEAIIKKEEKPEIMPVVELDTEECLIHPNVSIILLELKNLRSLCYLMNYGVWGILIRTYLTQNFMGKICPVVTRSQSFHYKSM